MALSAYDGYATYDRGGAWLVNDQAPRDVSPLFLAALRQGHSLINYLTVGEAVVNQKHEWFEDAINPDQITLVAGTNSVEDGDSTTLFSASAAHIKTVKIGDLLKNATQNIGEVMQVTAKPSTTTLTVTRGFGNSSGSASHAAGNNFWVIPGNQQGSAAGTDRTVTRSPKYNWSQIIDVDVQLSRNMVYMPQYNVKSEFDKSVIDRTYEGKRYLANAVINSMTHGTSSALPSDTAYPYMSGLIEMITYAGDPMTPASAQTTTIDSSTTTLTYDAVSDLVGLVYAQGGANDSSKMLIATNQTQFEVMATWPDGQLRRQYATSPMTYGGVVNEIVTKQNVHCPVVVDNYVPVGHLLALDLSRISIRPYVNSAWNMYKSEIGENRNDYKAARLLGEWTLEIHNAGTAHGMMTALT